MKKNKYKYLIDSPTGKIWQKIKINKRSGIAVPLFSLYSGSGIGIGEFTDLKLLVDWCRKTGFTIIQLLPLFDTGFDFCPYSSISSYALDYMYLNINELKGVDIKPYRDDLNLIKKKYPVNSLMVDYGIKQRKTELLWKIFTENSASIDNSHEKFTEENKYWLKDYSVFKVLSEKYGTSQWETWGEKSYNKEIKKHYTNSHRDKIAFYIWLQWQISEQLKEVKKYSGDNGVLLMGDIPFLVSRNSADVWAHQNYFNLDLSAGAPPDMYSAYGQSWGMPTYNWEYIEKDGYNYITARLKTADNYYDMYRIDHFIGLFRIWTMTYSPASNGSAVHGFFDPDDESKWESHGVKIIRKLLSSGKMLPCAEDLGTVPKCSNPTLFKYGIPGIDFQRFMKKEYDFIKPESYRTNSISTLSTHDSTFFINWWDYEAGSIEKELFEILCERNKVKSKTKKHIKDSLFDKNKSLHGRLFWRKELSELKLRSYLKYFLESKYELLNLFLYTYDEKRKYLKYLGLKKEPSKSDLISKSLTAINYSNSIFSIQHIQEYLCLDKKLLKKMNRWKYRINKPGTVGEDNWSLKLPVSLEKLLMMKINEDILEMNNKSNRVIQK